MLKNEDILSRLELIYKKQWQRLIATEQNTEQWVTEALKCHKINAIKKTVRKRMEQYK